PEGAASGAPAAKSPAPVPAPLAKAPLAAKATVAPAPPPASAPPHGSSRRWLGAVVAGVGVVALGVGTWAGLDARARRDDARRLGCNDDFSLCPVGPPLD